MECVSIDVAETSNIFGVCKSTIYKWVSYKWLTKEGVDIITDSLFWELARAKGKIIQAKKALGIEKLSSLNKGYKEREERKSYQELQRENEDLRRDIKELREIVERVKS